VRRDIFDNHCGDTALEYKGRFRRFQTPPKPMFYDRDLASLIPESNITYAPADLSQIPFYKGLAKFGKTAPKQFNRKAFDIAVKMMRKHFRLCKGARLTGMDEILQTVRLDTSPGPALKVLYNTKGDALSDAKFFKLYEEFEEGMLKTGGVNSYWGACSKQELRLKEKVRDGKTRVFMSGSLFFYLFSSKYCMDFNERFYESVFKNSSCVGMSKFSGGFHCVYSDLLNPENCGSLDASGWDTCMFNEMMWAIANFRRDCFLNNKNSDINIALANIYRQITGSLIMTPLGEVCSKEQGNPSGSPNTIVDNTLGHYLLKAYDWLVLSYSELDEELWEMYYDDFESSVSMKLFGDDDMFSVDDKSKDFYNPVSIIRASKELGFVLTTESEELRHREQLSFLSHYVRKEENGFYVPYLPIDRLCSAAVYSETSDIFIRAQRLSNLRYEGYHTPGWLSIIDRMISYFVELHNEPEVKAVFDCSLSDKEIEHLYLPLESLTPALKAEQGKNRSRLLKMNVCNEFSKWQSCCGLEEEISFKEKQKQKQASAQSTGSCKRACDGFGILNVQ